MNKKINFNQTKKDILKFITCGSVDDGKSTLLGRMLYEKKFIFLDQLSEIKNASNKYSSHNNNIDYSYLLDGLLSEREQKITIDVAYRYFETENRKFILADTPGHEQYTRNMVTGASNAELAIILLDVKKGIKEQTKRHSLICSLLNIPNILLAVNKMDLIGYSKKRYENIIEQYKRVLKKLDLSNISYMPLSALNGDNIVKNSKKMPWYKGPCLFDFLEKIDLQSQIKTSNNFYFPVQLVQTLKNNKRKYLGTVKSGTVREGEVLEILPSGVFNTVKKISMYKNNLKLANKNMSISISFKKETDISRGDILTSSKKLITVTDRFIAKIIWMDKVSAFIGRIYNLKIGHSIVTAQIVKIINKINTKSLSFEKANTLKMNDIAIIEVTLEKKIPLVKFKDNKDLGSFILIDKITNNTLAAGMLENIIKVSKNVFYSDSKITQKRRNILNGHKSKVIWFTGLSGAGKSTLAKGLENKLYKKGIRTYILDGDNLRTGINSDLGFSEEARVENIRRAAEISKLMVESGIVVLAAFISPYQAERNLARNLFKKGDFIEVFVKASLEYVEKRDVKGLYARARKGEIKNFTGIDSPYEIPSKPEFIINTDKEKIETSINNIYKALIFKLEI
ncbi:MAG: adenylyl-sulfate kinase [Rhodopirellula sp.]|nr:adenylyl-sulfate kinase [Rhodopirellula sp.]